MSNVCKDGVSRIGELIAFAVVFYVLSAAVPKVYAQDPLTTIESIRKLPVDKAEKNPPVLVDAQVVFVNPYRSSISGGPYTLLSEKPSIGYLAFDAPLAGETHYYVVTVVDDASNESLQSMEVSASSPEAIVMWSDIVGANLIISFSNGPANGWFSMLSKTNLLDSTWATNQTELPIDRFGFGSATNLIMYPQAFYRMVESGDAGYSPEVKRIF